MKLNHTYGILNTAELIIANPECWDNDTLNKFMNAAHRFTGGRVKDAHPLIKQAVAKAMHKLQPNGK